MPVNVSRTELQYFTSPDWKRARERCDLWVRSQIAFAGDTRGDLRMAVYYDEDAERYKLYSVVGGKSYLHELESWDEVSSRVYGNY